MGMDNPTWPNAEGVLKPETLTALEKAVNVATCRIVDGWVAANRKLVKKWEADGKLVEKAKEAQMQELKAQQAAVQMYGQNPPLSSWELAEMFGGASRIPHE